ncbi:MAG: beta-3-deoxy-D-manno-oct-2-ulosonic acid transferase [Alkalimonas sp.]|nr:beta-3-deoxy-D-manno-oct-2-ulosonic acid transferase [Alkalimonas sp.]
MRMALPKHIYAYGFSRFWRKTLQRFTQGSSITFLRKGAALPSQGTLLVWGRRALPAVQAGLRLIRLEDGFIRSVGLGAEFAQPMSWIFDQRGLYFDATQPSDLEQLLQELTLTDKQRTRAEALRERICAQGVTKYNVGQARWQRPDTSKTIVLVPGQVETDASIEYGANQVRSNLQLLMQVREKNPDAWVIYKPHPDVYSGARAQGAGEDEASAYCDELVLDVSMAVLLEQVDEVHLITSLTGFEALLRGKKVVCYGWPFYAGWGLTEDTLPAPRRGRQLDLATLVYATLIAYPRYISDVTGGFSSAEQVLMEIEQRRQQTPTTIDKAMLLVRRCLRWVLNLLFGKK